MKHDCQGMVDLKVQLITKFFSPKCANAIKLKPDPRDQAFIFSEIFAFNSRKPTDVVYDDLVVDDV